MKIEKRQMIALMLIMALFVVAIAEAQTGHFRRWRKYIPLPECVKDGLLIGLHQYRARLAEFETAVDGEVFTDVDGTEYTWDASRATELADEIALVEGLISDVEGLP